MVLSGPISQAFEGSGEDRVSTLDFFNICAGEKLPGKHSGCKTDVFIKLAKF